MSLPATLPTAILNTILGRLAVLFLAGAAGDLAEARQAAAQMLAEHQPETENELRLSANIVSFSFHALEALSQATTPDMPLTKILRLRGSAVSLSRESHKAERRLEQLQTARRAGQPEPQAAEPPTPPKIEKAIALVEQTRQATDLEQSRQTTETNTTNAPPIWSKSLQLREAARRISENLRKNQAAHAAKMNLAAALDQPAGQ